MCHPIEIQQPIADICASPVYSTPAAKIADVSTSCELIPAPFSSCELIPAGFYAVTERHSSPLAQEAKSSQTAEWPSGTLLSLVVLS